MTHLMQAYSQGRMASVTPSLSYVDAIRSGSRHVCLVNEKLRKR